MPIKPLNWELRERERQKERERETERERAHSEYSIPFNIVLSFEAEILINMTVHSFTNCT
jgi:hypothetical protein